MLFPNRSESCQFLGETCLHQVIDLKRSDPSDGRLAATKQLFIPQLPKVAACVLLAGDEFTPVAIKISANDEDSILSSTDMVNEFAESKKLRPVIWCPKPMYSRYIENGLHPAAWINPGDPAFDALAAISALRIKADPETVFGADVDIVRMVLNMDSTENDRVPVSVFVTFVRGMVTPEINFPAGCMAELPGSNMRQAIAVSERQIKADVLVDPEAKIEAICEHIQGAVATLGSEIPDDLFIQAGILMDAFRSC